MLFLARCDIIRDMAEKLNLAPLSGMPEWTPAQQLVFDDWKAKIRRIYSSFGYTPLETPALERAEVLLSKAGSTGKQVYQFERGDTKLALRFDQTVPLSRVVAAKQSTLPFPFRRQVIDRSWRGERAQLGRFREFYQADADIIGRGQLSLSADAEILAMASEAVASLNLGECQLQISNRKILMGFLETLGVMDQAAVVQLLDDAPKIGPKKLKEELALLRLDTFEIRKIVKFSEISGNFHAVSQELLRLDVDNEVFNEGLEELHELDKLLALYELPLGAYQYNMAIVRGLDYYTGMIFETWALDWPRLGSVCSGGRYDDLVGHLSKAKMPGVGCSIGLTRLFAGALDAGIIEETVQTNARVLIVPLSERRELIYPIAQVLRREGVNVILHDETSGLKKALKYANDLGIAFVLVIGDDELDAHRLTLKDMVTGQQMNYNLAQVLDVLRAV